MAEVGNIQIWETDAFFAALLGIIVQSKEKENRELVSDNKMHVWLVDGADVIEPKASSTRWR